MTERAAYSPEEFARQLGLSRAMIYKLLAAGSVRSVTIGRSRRIPASEVERVLNEGAPVLPTTTRFRNPAAPVCQWCDGEHATEDDELACIVDHGG